MTSQHSGHSMDDNRINPEYLAVLVRTSLLSFPAHRTPTAQWWRSLCSLPGGATVKALCSVSQVYPPPITPSQLNSWLSSSLSWASLHQLNIKAHSFRIGSYWRLSSGIFRSTDPTDGPLGIFRFQKIYSHHLFRNTASFHCYIFVSLAGVGRRAAFLFFLFGGGFQVICGLWCLPGSSAFGRVLGYNTRQTLAANPLFGGTCLDTLLFPLSLYPLIL